MPELVIGDPLILNPVGTVAATLVTVPVVELVPAPIAERKVAASKALTVLSALNLGNVIADGLVTVNKLLPRVVAPKFVLATEFVVAPVPPFATAKVPANVTAPVVPVDGVKPVVPALNDVTPALVRVTLPPKDTEPPPDKPVPAVTVTALFVRAALGMLVKPAPEPLNCVAESTPVEGTKLSLVDVTSSA